MKKNLAVIILISLNSCIFFDNGSRKIVGDYDITWIDVPANQFISSSDKVLIEGYVFAVGHNDNYIIAKQHPNNGFDGNYEINISTTNYFVIKIDAIDTNEKVVGPLTLKEFELFVKRHNISDIKFSIKDIENP